MKLNGNDFRGKILKITDTGINAVQETYSEATVDTGGNVISKSIYVEIDTTHFFDVYHLPNTAEIVHAVNTTFGFDDSKTLLRRFGRDKGLYTIETKHPSYMHKSPTWNTTEGKYRPRPLKKL